MSCVRTDSPLETVTRLLDNAFRMGREFRNNDRRGDKLNTIKLCSYESQANKTHVHLTRKSKYVFLFLVVVMCE